MNWVYESSLVLEAIQAGRIPELSRFGVYLGIEVVLAPFFWIWTRLPIQHPNLANLTPNTTPAIALAIVMKAPIFLSDIATLILLLRIVRLVTKSTQKSIVAGLTWSVNPYNLYILYFFGAMDIVPVAIFLLTLYFELEEGWFRCGVSAILSGLLRLFAFAVYPFLIPLTRTKRSKLYLLLGSVFPMVFAVGLLYLSHDSLAVVFDIPAKEFWLLQFLGFNVLGMQFVRLSPVLVLLQLYVVLRFWRSDTNVIYLTSVSLLALLLGATLYGGEAQHFLWVCPLLSACVAMQPEDLWIYVLTFFTALMSPTVNPFTRWMPELLALETFLGGAFYAMKTVYLLKLNLWNLRLPRPPAARTQSSNPYYTTGLCAEATQEAGFAS